MATPNFWNDREQAQATVAELKALKSLIEPLQQLANGAEELQVLAELAAEG